MPHSLLPLEAYGISPRYGFLPTEIPIDKLPDPYYSKWEIIAGNLQDFIHNKRLRDVIEQLPVLSTAGLKHDSEWRRAYSILCFMAHSYIWGDDIPSERLPASISIPLLHISEYLELPPVATYAAVCLWNFKDLLKNKGLENLDNIATLTTFTGSTDESWFYLISVAIEACGAPIIPLMLSAIDAARINDVETVTSCIFYHRIRPFLAGSRNMENAGLANGVIYDDGTGSKDFRQYAGGSNAQSSLIQFFDIVLGVKHLPTSGGKDISSSPNSQSVFPSSSKNFLLEMRNYMPGPHRRFLEDVSMIANIRDYVHTNQYDNQLTWAYDACLKMLCDFRSCHINIVSRYIILKSLEFKSHLSMKSPNIQCRKVDIATSSSRNQKKLTDKKNLTGTGGTSLIPFLKQTRDETSEPAINAWTRHIMNRADKISMREHHSDGRIDHGPSSENQDCKNYGSSPCYD